MVNYPQELAQDAVCQSHTGHKTVLWFLLARSLRLNANDDDDDDDDFRRTLNSVTNIDARHKGMNNKKTTI